MSFDIDGDGVPDVVIKDTNGTTAYVNLSTIAKWAGAAVSALTVVVLGYINL